MLYSVTLNDPFFIPQFPPVYITYDDDSESSIWSDKKSMYDAKKSMFKEFIFREANNGISCENCYRRIVFYGQLLCGPFRDVGDADMPKSNYYKRVFKEEYCCRYKKGPVQLSIPFLRPEKTL